MTYAWYDILGTVGIRSHYNWVLLTGQRFRLFLAVDQGVGYEERIARGRQDAGVPTSVPFKTETELSQINGVAIDTALSISRKQNSWLFLFFAVSQTNEVRAASKRRIGKYACTSVRITT